MLPNVNSCFIMRIFAYDETVYVIFKSEVKWKIMRCVFHKKALLCCPMIWLLEF